MGGSGTGIYLPDRRTKCSRPLVSSHVPAGFPSAAEDYVEGRIDLNRDLIRHPLTTFYIRVVGDSMVPEIYLGSLLIGEVRRGDAGGGRARVRGCRTDNRER
jgi:SOS-response transcriptional repressor LexA